MSYVNINRTYYETNYTPTQNTRVECKVSVIEWDTSDSDGCIFGRCYYYSGYNSQYSFNLYCNRSRENWTYNIGGQFNDYAHPFQVNTPYVLSLKTSEFVCDNTTVAISNANFINGGYSGFPIGARKKIGGGYNQYESITNFDLYYFKIYEGNSLVRNYIPKLYNGVACLYDTIGETYLQPNDSSKVTYVGGINVSPSSKTFKATGGTQTITINADNDWSASTESDWFTLSAYSGESGTTNITLTAPEYSGSVDRQGTITFTSGQETETFTVKQKKVSSGSDTIRIGANAIGGGYIGATKLATAYIGSSQFWSSGPFTGLTITSSKTFLASGGTSTLKVKAGADWTITTDADWITLSAISGGTGVTEISITADTYSSTAENRTTIITAYTASVTKTCTITQKKVYTGPANNEIWYTTTDDTALSYTSYAKAYDSNNYELTLLSNTYQDGLGVLSYSGNIDHLNSHFFGTGKNTNLSSVDLPASLRQLPDYFIYDNGMNWTGLTINSPLLTYIGHECISTDGPTRFRIDVQEVRGQINFWALWGGNIEGFSCTEASGITQIGSTSWPNYLPWNSNFSYLRLPNVAVSFDISQITGMTASALVDLLNDLAVVSNKTLKMGSYNLGLLSAEQKAIATNKGWSLTT